MFSIPVMTNLDPRKNKEKFNQGEFNPIMIFNQLTRLNLLPKNIRSLPGQNSRMCNGKSIVQEFF